MAQEIADGSRAAIDGMDKARKEAERNLLQTARNIADVAALHGDRLTDAKIKEVLEMGANLTSKGAVSKALKEPRGWLPDQPQPMANVTATYDTDQILQAMNASFGQLRTDIGMDPGFRSWKGSLLILAC
ncbi:hypothetical protein SLS55_010282 [Diplodia seriata]|uniref:Uncharacterized protein n=1 Tax=Diplodia seriata TaxID=420778 RepID=A0ABR3BYR7_9PEZI